MDKLYLRGLIGQYWYNFTELLAYCILYRPTPKNLLYERKIKYGEDKLQYINTYTRKDINNEKKPLLIYIHGGGWISGLTGMRNSYVKNWAQKGFYVASISYSYAPQKIFPHQLKEIYAAIDFILDNAEKNKIDTDKIVIAGESAGGYFISYVASCISNPPRLDKLGINFKHQDTFKINALVAHSGCYNLCRLTDDNKEQSHFPDVKMMIESFIGKDLESTKKLLNSEEGSIYSPVIDHNFPPSFVVWTDKDKLRYEAFDFSKELQENNVPFLLYKSDGITGLHGWSIVTVFKKAKKCFDATIDFVSQYLN